jgi:hypothetical protein
LNQQTIWQCKCTKLQGTINHLARATRAICYCSDCQVYAHYLAAEQLLDTHGGTQVYAVSPKQVCITKGLQHLACVSLTPMGNYRFYATCCNTPICNFSRKPSTVHVSFIYSCLPAAVPGQAASAQPLYAKRKYAIGQAPANNPIVFMALALRYVYLVLLALIARDNRFNPFIKQATQQPVGGCAVVDKQTLQRLTALVQHNKALL